MPSRLVRHDSLRWMKSLRERKDEKTDLVRRSNANGNEARQTSKSTRVSRKTCTKTGDKNKHNKCKESSSTDAYQPNDEVQRSDQESSNRNKYYTSDMRKHRIRRENMQSNKTLEETLDNRRKTRETRSKSRDKRGKSRTRNGKSLEKRDHRRERRGTNRELRDGVIQEPVMQNRKVRDSRTESKGPYLERVRPHRERNEETMKKEVQEKVKNNTYNSLHVPRNKYEEYALEKLNLGRRSRPKKSNENLYYCDVQCDDKTAKINNCRKAVLR